MLIKVKKDLSKVTVIQNGNRYDFNVSISYRLTPVGECTTEEIAFKAKRVSQILNNNDVPLGVFVGTRDTAIEYEKIARKLYRGTIREAESFLSDFTDTEREEVISRIFNMNKENKNVQSNS